MTSTKRLYLAPDAPTVYESDHYLVMDKVGSDSAVKILASDFLHEIVAARDSYLSLDARLDAFVFAGGNVATKANGVSAAGQKVVTVDSSTGFIDTAYVAYALAGGAIEYNQIDSIDSPTQITLTTNIGTGGIADDTYFAMISSAEYARIAAVDYTNAVFVDSAGSDTNGALGRPDRAFATIDAALDELGAGGGAVYIGVGTFAPVTRAKIKAYTKFYGSGKPQSVNNTHLEGGTVIQGPLGSFVDGVEFHDLGVDSGSNVCTALYAGVAQEGFLVANLVPSLLEVVSDIAVSNVSVICQSALAAVHCFLIESATNVTVSNINTTYGLHGVALKVTYATLSNIRSFGSANDNMIIKSDATSLCHDVTVVGLTMAAVVSGDAGGLILSSNHADGLSNVNVVGATAVGTSYGVTFQQTQGVFRNINIDVQIYAPGTGTVNLNSLPFEDSIKINGSPVAPLTIASSGQPAFENSWTSFSTPNGVAKFYRSQGRVFLMGGVSGGALNTVIFTLPAGYRPPETERIPVATNKTTPANIAISANGEVLFEQGAADTGWLFLTGSFWVGP